MNKLVALSVLAVTVQGAMYAEGDWRSVADAAVVAQDKELREQAQTSIRQMVGALDDFVSLAMKKIATRSNVQDQQNLKEFVVQLEQLLTIYKTAFEEGDEELMDARTQQEFIQIAQGLWTHCMPLMVLFSENMSEQLDDELAKAVRVELFENVQKMVTRIKNDLS